MHFKVTRHFENQDIVASKDEVEIHCGFRKFKIRPIYSSELGSNILDKYKYMRFMRPDTNLIASVYCPIVFSPCKVLMFNRNKETGEL